MMLFAKGAEFLRVLLETALRREAFQVMIDIAQRQLNHGQPLEMMRGR